MVSLSFPSIDPTNKHSGFYYFSSFIFHEAFTTCFLYIFKKNFVVFTLPVEYVPLPFFKKGQEPKYFSDLLKNID